MSRTSSSESDSSYVIFASVASVVSSMLHVFGYAMWKNDAVRKFGSAAKCFSPASVT